MTVTRMSVGCVEGKCRPVYFYALGVKCTL